MEGKQIMHTIRICQCGNFGARIGYIVIVLSASHPLFFFPLQALFTLLRRRTGRQRIHTFMRLLKAMTLLTVPVPSLHSSTCSSVRSCSTCESWVFLVSLTFSFFIEHFELVKPVCLCLYRPEDVQSLTSGKLALRYAGRQVDVWAELNLTVQLCNTGINYILQYIQIEK